MKKHVYRFMVAAMLTQLILGVVTKVCTERTIKAATSSHQAQCQQVLDAIDNKE